MCAAETNIIPRVTIAGNDVRVDQINPPVGSENSSIWCKNIDELIGVITHGIGHKLTSDGWYIQHYAISELDALTVAEYLMHEGKADPVIDNGKLIGWNIHHWGTDD